MGQRTIGRLSARQVSNAKPKRGLKYATLLSDGGCLYLQLTRGEGDHVRRSWIFRYERDGKRCEMGLGPLHSRGLKEARVEAMRLRQLLLDGIDPLAAKNQQVQQRRLESAKSMTFGACVAAYLETHDAGWKSDKHRRQWRMTLTEYCKAITDLPVAAVDTDLVLRVLTPLWKTKTDTGARLRGRIERVLSWAKGRGLRGGENPARWQGHLDEMLAAPRKVKGIRHHPAMPYAELPAFMAELCNRHSLSARALEVTILTGLRTSETIGAHWSEIDFDAKVWTIPASRMKSRRQHRVPLADRAVSILKALPRHGDRVFKLSDRPMLELLRGMRPGLTVHGFRSSFRDWCKEQTNFPREVAELALAHVVADKSEAAYSRGDALDKRRQLMAAWERYCSKPAATGATVTPMRKLADA
jgi:integrase